MSVYKISVTDSIEVQLKCQNEECAKSVLYHIDLNCCKFFTPTSNEDGEEVEEVDFSKYRDQVIVVQDMEIHIHPPTISLITTIEKEEKEEPSGFSLFKIIASSIAKITHNGTEYTNVPQKIKEEWLERMPSKQLAKLLSVFKNYPKLGYRDGVTCPDCGHKIDVKLSGISDFFQ
jgi:hypothetical protein